MVVVNNKNYQNFLEKELTVSNPIHLSSDDNICEFYEKKKRK